MRPSLSILAAALVLAGIAGWLDARRGRIPNWLTLPVLAVSPLLHAFLARSQPPMFGVPAAFFIMGWSLASALVAGLVPYLLFKLGLAGGGDAKLLAALGALLLPEVALAAEFSAFAAAAFFVPARLAYRGDLFATVGELFDFVARPLRKRAPVVAAPLVLAEPLRFGPFIFIGTLLAPLVARGLS